MSTVQHAKDNILESAASVSATGSFTYDANTPLSRIYDRSAARRFNAIGGFDIRIYQGASPLPLDFLAIHPNHGIGGTVSVFTSADGSTWSLRSSAVATAGTAFVWQNDSLVTGLPAQITGSAAAYIRVTCNVTCWMTEMWAGARYAWPVGPQRPGGNEVTIPNVLRERTAYGSDRFTLMGPPRRRIEWNVEGIEQDQRNELVALAEDSVAGYKPVWIKDYSGNWIYTTPEIDVRETGAGLWSAAVRAEEIIA